MLLPHEKKLLISLIEKIEVQTSCVDCINYKNEKCALVNAAPPMEVLFKGCEKWTYDETSIPFPG